MSFVAAQAAGSLIQGIGGFLSGQAQNKADRKAARDTRLTEVAQENQLRSEARAKIGAQLAGQFSNGFEGGSGTALDALRESEINAALDAMEIRRQGIAKSDALKAAGHQAAMEGDFALASGVLGAASDVQGGRSDWAQARAGVSYGG